MNKKDKENNVNKFNSNCISKKLDLAPIPLNQIKSLVYMNIKDFSIFNTQTQNKSNEKRKNHFLFGDNEETPVKYFNIFKNNNKKIINDNKNTYINSINQKVVINDKKGKENQLDDISSANKE